MATTVKSRKAKGRALQNEIRDAILETFPLISPEEVKVAIMGERGVDIHLSNVARTLFGNYAIECKNQESLSIWSALKQAEENAVHKVRGKPLLFFRRNRSPTYVVMRKEDFFELVKRK